MKTALIAFVCFVLGGVVIYSFTQFQKVQQENQELKTKIQISSTPTPSPMEKKMQPSPTEEKSMDKKPEKGTISGTLGYPSSGIPPLQVYAINTTDSKKYFMIETAQNQGAFEIEDVEPGTYHVIAYTKDNGLSGAYSKAVPCGLSVDCTDHSMIEVVVKSGEVTKGIEVKDWYAPEGTFPSKP